ncbi:MAG: protein-(glutamine-N5) methyltransferase, release factor-specific [Myxococcales bacterium]|nr:protein-(glutamine-N5) methyltransferase, release factor-specific [Myxococcales bacterium]|tara:strand:- start:839 stop:1696 length:858 start_codon:yes stop_codon:yes gene_type:complete
MSRDVWTLSRVIKWTTGFFDRKGSESARLDAELLIAHALKMSRMQLYTEHHKPLSAEELASTRALVARRGDGEPVAYIIGQKAFWTIELAVDKRVLIPRPETEHLVEHGLERMRGMPNPRVLDLCCGSGCVGLAVAATRRDCKVLGTDVSEDALALAQTNRDSLDLGHATFQKSDAFEAIEDTFDVILSNPPYISHTQLEALMPSVKNYEPRLALDGGTDGLTFYRLIAANGHKYLKSGGSILVEIGFDQGPTVSDLFKTNGYREIRIHKDYSGHDRVVEAQPPE